MGSFACRAQLEGEGNIFAEADAIILLKDSTLLALAGSIVDEGAIGTAHIVQDVLSIGVADLGMAA